MAKAVIVLDPAFAVGKTDPRLFGSSSSISDDASMEAYSSQGIRPPTVKDSDRMSWSWSANLASP